MYPGHANRLYDARLAEIADTGATDVALVVSWSQATVASTTIGPTRAVTVDDDQLRHAVQRARRLGLAVTVFPILDVRKTREGAWRGTLAPADIDGWWRSYEAFILHYARIAQAEGASALIVGSELATTEAWRDRWFHLIGRVEDAFDGALIYSANWDHFESVSFWQRVDYIGVSAYFELTDDSDASEADLTRAWRARRDELVAYAKRVGKPLWITEIGYPSMDGAARWPWNYTRKAPIDLEEQRRCYAAFVAAWDGVESLGGAFFWIWWGDGGPKDRTYTPRGKPAEAILRAWYGGQ